MCPGHSSCYISGQYDLFGGPCLPCVNWLRGLANPLTPLEDRLGCVASLKDWLRRIIRHNKEHKINVTACSDPLMLEIFKSRKGILPECEPLLRRLNAIRCGLDMDFPELASPVSTCSTPNPTPKTVAKKSYSQAVASIEGQPPPRAVVAGSLTAPEGLLRGQSGPRPCVLPLLWRKPRLSRRAQGILWS